MEPAEGLENRARLVARCFQRLLGLRWGRGALVCFSYTATRERERMEGPPGPGHGVQLWLTAGASGRGGGDAPLDHSRPPRCLRPGGWPLATFLVRGGSARCGGAGAVRLGCPGSLLAWDGGCACVAVCICGGELRPYPRARPDVCTHTLTPAIPLAEPQDLAGGPTTSRQDPQSLAAVGHRRHDNPADSVTAGIQMSIYLLPAEKACE